MGTFLFALLLMWGGSALQFPPIKRWLDEPSPVEKYRRRRQIVDRTNRLPPEENSESVLLTPETESVHP